MRRALILPSLCSNPALASHMPVSNLLVCEMELTQPPRWLMLTTKKNSTRKLTAAWKVLSIWDWQWRRWGLDGGDDRGGDMMTSGMMVKMIQEWWSFLPRAGSARGSPRLV